MADEELSVNDRHGHARWHRTRRERRECFRRAAAFDELIR